MSLDTNYATYHLPLYLFTMKDCSANVETADMSRCVKTFLETVCIVLSHVFASE